MRLGIIGRGRWGNVYAKTLDDMGIEYWQAGRDWRKKSAADAVIIASSPESHYSLAKQLICESVPVLIEKPVCLASDRAAKLLKLARYRKLSVFAGHTHLFSTQWRELKKRLNGVKTIESSSGGPCKLDPLWDWGPHDVAMCIDLLGMPQTVTMDNGNIDLRWESATARLSIGKQAVARKFVVDGLCYTPTLDKPTPLETLIGEFLASVADVSGLEMGLKVVQVLEAAAGHRAKSDAD